jgi:hypothetical protein
MTLTIEDPVEDRVQAFIDGEDLSFDAMLATSLEALDVFSASFTDDPMLLDNLAWRVTVSFENGTLFTLTNENQCVVSHRAGTVIDKPTSNPGDCEWIWDGAVAGWVAEPSFDTDVEEVINFSNSLIEANGKPTLVLPWQNFADTVIEELELDEDSELDEDNYLAYLLNALNSDGDRETEDYAIKFTHDSEYLSNDCAVKRYWLLEEEMNEVHSWLIISECCATCVGGALTEKYKETPEATDWPKLIVWTQNAGYWSTPAGSWNYEYEINELTDEQIELFASKASEFGFNASRKDNLLVLESST